MLAFSKQSNKIMTQFDTTVIVKIVLIELKRRVICVAGVALYCHVVALCSFLLFHVVCALGIVFWLFFIKISFTSGKLTGFCAC